MSRTNLVDCDDPFVKFIFVRVMNTSKGSPSFFF
jgi:hypothetical protein